MKRSSALALVQKYFPNVEKVVDAHKPVRLNVTPEDVSHGREKDPQECAFAKACVRQLRADGALINITTSYVVKGRIATRYLTSETVGREITSFDRHRDFAAGMNYLLAAVNPAKQLGRKQSETKGTPANGNRPMPRAIHRTENIRVSLK
jgi:hypothetical protein